MDGERLGQAGLPDHIIAGGDCEHCRSGYFIFCANRRGMGHGRRLHPLQIHEVIDVVNDRIELVVRDTVRKMKHGRQGDLVKNLRHTTPALCKLGPDK